jgi:hypothetical protein
VSCPLCRERKGKRPCPAKGERICSSCCGSKRLVEIDCPADCAYLTGAHAGTWSGRATERERDQRRIAPYLQDLSELQLGLLLGALVGIERLRHERRDLLDRMLLDALQALRKTVETRGHGILYEHAAADLRAQGLLHELRGLFEAEDEQRGRRAPDDRDLLPVLRALESMVLAATRDGGPTAFLEMAGRIASDVERETRPKAPRLIVAP